MKGGKMSTPASPTSTAVTTDLVVAIDNTGVSPQVRSRIYMTAVIVSFTMGLIAALIPIFTSETIALEVVAAIGVIGSWAGALGSGLAVAYRPTATITEKEILT